MLSLGQIEVIGLPAAIEAADVALKSANVELIGYETTDGMGMVAVKIVGQVAAVQAAIAAASIAAAKVSKVISTSVIPRPSEQIESIVYSKTTVGRPASAPVKAPAGSAQPEKPAEPEPTVEIVEPEATLVEPVAATKAEKTLVEPLAATEPEGVVDPVATTSIAAAERKAPARRAPRRITKPVPEPATQPVETAAAPKLPPVPRTAPKKSRRPNRA